MSSSETRQKKNLQTQAKIQNTNNYEQQLSMCGEDILKDHLCQNVFHNNTIMIIVFFILILRSTEWRFPEAM